MWCKIMVKCKNCENLSYDKEKKTFGCYTLFIKISKEDILKDHDCKDFKENETFFKYSTSEEREHLYLFSSELFMISDIKIREFTRKALELVPAYFWHIRSSLTGNNHPPDENKVGGLVLHTKRVVRTVVAFWDTFPTNSQEELNLDLLIASAILHDCWKCGLAGRELKDKEGNLQTDPLHPIYAYQGLFHLKPDYKEIYETVCAIISIHMGKWAPYKLNIRDNKTRTMGAFLHLADALCSQKFVKIEPL